MPPGRDPLVPQGHDPPDPPGGNLTREPAEAQYREECLSHLSVLSEALRSDEPAIFVDHVVWFRSVTSARHLPADQLARTLEFLQAALCRHLPAEDAAAAAALIGVSLDQLKIPADVPPSVLSGTAPNVQLARDYLALLLKTDRKAAADLVQRAIGEGLPLRSVYLDVFQQSQREVGRLWQLNRISIAQEHYCTAATQAIMNQFFSQVLATPRIGRRVIAFCVARDLHEIGLRIVADFFELAGWDCDFLGANTPAETMLESIAAAPPDLIAISATMAHHVALIETFIKALRARPETAGVPVLVGGRPFSIAENLWRHVGADGWAADAESAVLKGEELVHAG